MTRRLAQLLAAVATAVALAVPSAAPATSVDRTCELALVKADPNVLNLAFPDDSASYWLLSYQGVPGTRIRITGSYPHARYTSFNVYDPAARPIDSLNDTQIVADAGSSNPFLPGADRTAEARGYTVTVEFGAPPAQRAPNTLYAGQGQNGLPNFHGTMLYRLYVPDAGRDEFGDVGLPRFTLEAADGGDPLSAADCRRLSKPSIDLNRELAKVSPPAEADVLRWPGKDPPVWRRFVNLPTAYADGVLENGYTDPVRQEANRAPLGSLGGRGGFYSNLDNDYAYAPISRGHGQVLVLRGKAPTFADTGAGAATMPAGQELRYFSFCQNEAFTTRYLSCLRDDQLVLDADGRYTIVVSTAAARPAEATRACGVSWVPWGPVEEGVLIYRHMLPDPTFEHAIQRIANHGDEEQVLGDYYPRGEYMAGPAEFDARWECEG